MYAPFGTLPLSGSPYWSRINKNYSDSVVKNHYIVAFNPGFALQASELNEVQEQFYINSNLTQRMNSIWQAEGFTIPFWEGSVPRCPRCVEVGTPEVVTIGGEQYIGFVALFYTTWFYWTDATSKMSFWVYNGLNTDNLGYYRKQFALPTNSTQYVGFTGAVSDVLCCPNADATCTDEQQLLRDNSQGNVNTFNTCGATRKKVSILDADIRDNSTLTSTFYPIFEVVTATNPSDTQFTYLDGQNITPSAS